MCSGGGSSSGQTGHFTGSSRTWTTTPDQASVISCLNSASAGDTINVTAGTGSVTWSTTYTHPGDGNDSCLLCVTKGVNIVGPGAGNLTIVNGGSSGAFIVEVIFSSLASTNTFTMGGFTFDTYSKQGIRLGHSGSDNSTAPYAKQYIRIYNNNFISSNGTNGNDGGAIWNGGPYYGVIDHNTFNNCDMILWDSFGVTDNNWWASSCVGCPSYVAGDFDYFSLGSEYYMYVEDNVFNMTNTDGMVSNGEYASRYVFRYNTINTPYANTSIFETHGQQSAMAASFGCEIYGNQVNATNNSYIQLYKQRSGQTRVFFNDVQSTGSTPSMSGYTGGLDVCPSDSYVASKVTHNSYWFYNRQNMTGSFFSTSASGGLTCNGLSNIPTMGRDIFSDTSTPGVTCGTLAARPSTCTTGQGYWATNQSCTDLTGLVGDIVTYPTRSTITGSLYKCVSTNTWSVDNDGITYTPYTYPHPLRQ
jgi:hypothetical protein